MSKNSAYCIPDQSGKIFLITGSNSGLGKEAVLRLVQAGGRAIMAVRNLDKGKKLKQTIYGKYLRHRSM